MAVPKLRFPEFSGEWEEKKLGEVSKIQRGASPRPIVAKKWYSDKKDVGWVRITDVTKSKKVLLETEDYFSDAGIKKSRYLPLGSLIMSICATIGKPIITGINTCIHDGFIGFSNLKGVQKEFLYYYLLVLENKFISLGQTGSQANLNSDLVRITKISIPSDSEQRKIASFLSKVDSKIEKLEKKQELWETYKKGIMQQIFSQELRFKDENGEDYPDWEEKRLGDIANIVGGGTPSTDNSDYWNGDINWYTPSEIGKTKYVRSSSRKISNTGLKNSSAKILPEGTVLLSSRATIGEMSILINESTTNQGFQSLIVDNKNFNEFVYYLGSVFKKDLIRNASGSTFLEISKKEIAKIKINIPSRQEQIKISQFLSDIDFKLENLNKELKINKKFKKGLLQQIFC